MRVETRNLQTIAQCIECRARLLSDGQITHWPDCSASPSLSGVDQPSDVAHYSVQFSAHAGYLLNLPCPESPEIRAITVKVARNGFRGRVLLVQQAFRNGFLVPICMCGGCGARWNVPTFEQAEPLIVACRSEADRPGNGGSGSWWHTVADRIAAGYGVSRAQIA